MTKKKPAKKRPHDVTAYDSKGYIVPTKATVAVPRPKKRTAGVEVVTLKAWAVRTRFGELMSESISRTKWFAGRYRRCDSDTLVAVTITYVRPKRRSSK